MVGTPCRMPTLSPGMPSVLAGMKTWVWMSISPGVISAPSTSTTVASGAASAAMRPSVMYTSPGAEP